MLYEAAKTAASFFVRSSTMSRQLAKCLLNILLTSVVLRYILFTVIKMDKQINFGENLKFYREQNFLTQDKLAELIGFSAKSISKWESGKGLPTLSTLCRLSEIFLVSADKLLYANNRASYYLAIDGGGSKTMFLLADQNQNVIKTLCLGASNPNDIGMDNAKAILQNGIKNICSGLPVSKIKMFAGLSGGTTGDNQKILARFFSEFGFESFKNGSDIDNIIALGNDEKQIFIILGTGIICYAKNNGKLKRIAGWGQFFDAGGSGYNLGKDAIYADLQSIDGTGKKTVISDLIYKRLGENSEKHLAKFYKNGKKYIASFSNIVFEACRAGDETAKNILDENFKCVAKIIDAAQKFTGGQNTTVLFAGGISSQHKIIFPIIKKHMPKNNLNFKVCDKEPVYGALQLALKEDVKNA